ncbi:hypothetical protein HDV02_005746 [Globomyces sp. JEL0801]|nr:hypothetical protein HDV02_005746 [Globomyces sp. JEL0801]
MTGDVYFSAAIQFVENIYTLLTGRYIKHLPSTLDETEIIPHFALPTTANAIKYMAKSPEKARIVLEAHTEFLKQLRIQRKDEIKKIMIQQKRTLEPLKEVVVSQKTHIKVKQI